MTKKQNKQVSSLTKTLADMVETIEIERTEQHKRVRAAMEAVMEAHKLRLIMMEKMEKEGELFD